MDYLLLVADISIRGMIITCEVPGRMGQYLVVFGPLLEVLLRLCSRILSTADEFTQLMLSAARNIWGAAESCVKSSLSSLK